VLEEGLTFLALFALADPIRAGAKQAVMWAIANGMNVRMLSGDDIHTARKVGVEVGMVTKEEISHHKYSHLTGYNFYHEIDGMDAYQKENGEEVFDIKKKKKFE